MSFTWLRSERNVSYSQFALRFIDEFTGGPSLYPVEVSLSLLDGAGGWRELDTRPTRSPSGNLLFPGLGRSANVATAPMVRHRVQITSARYRPEYLRTLDSIEFDVHPYDDTHAPAVVPIAPETVLLLPTANYPFPTHVRTVRGQTLDTAGDPLGNVEVVHNVAERVLSDERGVFALPLRWAPLSGAVTLDATDHRSGRTGQITLTLPDDLQQGHTLTLS